MKLSKKLLSAFLVMIMLLTSVSGGVTVIAAGEADVVSAGFKREHVIIIVKNAISLICPIIF